MNSLEQDQVIQVCDTSVELERNHGHLCDPETLAFINDTTDAYPYMRRAPLAYQLVVCILSLSITFFGIFLRIFIFEFIWWTFQQHLFKKAWSFYRIFLYLKMFKLFRTCGVNMVDKFFSAHPPKWKASSTWWSSCSSSTAYSWPSTTSGLASPSCCHSHSKMFSVEAFALGSELLEHSASLETSFGARLWQWRGFFTSKEYDGWSKLVILYFRP